MSQAKPETALPLPVEPARTPAPPVNDARGQVQCTECDDFVPFESMFLDEHGYFCARCAIELVARTSDAGDRPSGSDRP